MTPTRQWLTQDEIDDRIDAKLRVFGDGHTAEFKGLRDQMTSLASEVRENKSTTDCKLAKIGEQFTRFYNEDTQAPGYLQIARASDQRRHEEQDTKTNLLLTQVNVLVADQAMRTARSAAIADLIKWLKIASTLLAAVGGIGGIAAILHAAAVAHR